MTGVSNLRVFITCRLAEYKAAFPHVQPFTIEPLSPQQIGTFAERWLGMEQAPRFCRAVAAAPYAGAEVVPLMLAHLCALYERHGDLPKRPLDVYEQIVSLLVEEWDRQRGVNRGSGYADFAPRKKERFLQAIAYELTRKGRRGTFYDSDLTAAYKKVASVFGLPRESAREVVEEIESHTGLVLQSGNRKFDFFHLTIQEYLTAMHAQRLSDASRLLFPNHPNELALVVAASPEISGYLARILEVIGDAGTEFVPERNAFLDVFFTRLAAEHPPIQVSRQLGWTLLGLITLGLRPLQRDERPDVAMSNPALFSIEEFRESIQLVLHGSDPVHDAWGYTIKLQQLRRSYRVPGRITSFVEPQRLRAVMLVLMNASRRTETTKIDITKPTDQAESS